MKIEGWPVRVRYRLGEGGHSVWCDIRMVAALADEPLLVTDVLFSAAGRTPSEAFDSAAATALHAVIPRKVWKKHMRGTA